MLYTQFRDKLEQVVAVERAHDPATGLFAVRAAGKWRRGYFDLNPGHDRTGVSDPFIAVISSDHQDIEERTYGIVLASSNVPMERTTDFFVRVGATANALQIPGSDLTYVGLTVPKLEWPGSRLSYPYGEPLPFAYIEGEPGSLAVRGEPTLSPSMCLALEHLV